MKTSEEIERAFRNWWYEEGSGMPPKKGEETCSHVERVARIAWLNGAYIATGEKLRALIAQVEDIASTVANVSTDSQARDDCGTICQIIHDYRTNGEVPGDEGRPGQ